MCQSYHFSVLGGVAKNKALLAKWHWRFPERENPYQTIAAIYGYNMNGWDPGEGEGEGSSLDYV